MKVAIIGCGYVGTAIARKLSDLNYLVTATTTTLERVTELQAVAQQVLVATGDNETSLLAALKNQDVGIVTIAPTGNEQVDEDGYKATYLHTAKNLVRILQQLPTVKHLIYTSSCGVYGNSNGEWVNEESPVVLDNEHAKILHDTEKILLAASSLNFKVCILRLGAIYGSGREIGKRFSKLAGTTRPGNGDNFTNWIHLDDIVSAVNFALTYELQGIYNVVNDTPLTSREMLDRVCEMNHLPLVEWDASLPRNKTNNQRVSNQKLKGLGYKLIHAETEI
ncbi:SDR family oxidoreductase [Nostocales cyanobacterium LEGE 12452]|nr:SDR family oxidoreductase [Nostocales cyanobacterium LEGE 12452]